MQITTPSCLGIPFPFPSLALLHCNRLRQVSGEVHIETLSNGEPVGNELKGNDVQKALEAVDGLGNFDLLGLRGRELVVVRIANDDWAATTGNHYHG
jgi:hypothetical protein